MDEVGFVLGRFQFLHEGHEHLLNEAASRCKKLIVLVGSADKGRTPKNPLSFEERKHCLELTLDAFMDTEYVIHPVGDSRYDDDLWLNALIMNLEIKSGVEFMGYTYPLYCFIRGNDQAERLCMEEYFRTECLGEETYSTSSTQLRNMYYRGLDWSTGKVAKDVGVYISTLDLSSVLVEVDDEEEYEERWDRARAVAPFPLPHFDCTDVIVRRRGRILTILRGESPGIGKIALPGGFLDVTDVSYESGAARELEEETGLIVDPGDLELEAYLTGTQRGGNRSTHVFSVDFEKCSGKLKAQKGEVQSIAWVKPPTVGARGWFADHGDILHMTERFYG